ncbi:hypothetical protein C1646_677981 [Rhizophagus diaphanus]|nr:hypothetical protein C1646_677981 [Rhizophagus diaphanus] [Rhizophagus sp. MUCL 43196]
MVKKAGGDAAVPLRSQTRIFMKGLLLEFIKDVYLRRPADLAEAITATRNVKTGIKAIAAKYSNKEIIEEKSMEEILKEETNKYKKINPIIKELQNKEVKNDEIDDLIGRMKKMEIHMMKINFIIEQRQKEKETRERNNICGNCEQIGHFTKNCSNDRVKHKEPNVEDFELTNGLMNSNVPITWEQYIKEKPNVAKKLRNRLKY